VSALTLQSLPKELARSAGSLRLAAEIAIWRYGALWVLSAVAVIIALVLLVAQVVPLRAALEANKRQLAQLTVENGAQNAQRRARSAAAHAALEASQLSAAGLPAVAQADSEVRRIYRLASLHGLELPQSLFQTSRDARTGITRVQVNSTVTASYPQLRLFIETLLRQMPHVTVDQLTFSRENIGQDHIKAELRISCWLRDGKRA